MMRAPLLMLLWLTLGAENSNAQNSNAQNSYAHSREQYFANIDINRNGGVSIFEFQEWMAYSFNRIDKNANNIIDANEALVPKMAGVTRAQHQANIAAQFRRQDRNKNGELSMLELTAPPQ